MGRITREFGGTITDRRQRNLFIWMYCLTILTIIIAPVLGSRINLAAMVLFVASLAVLPLTYNYALVYGLIPFANIFKLSPETISFLTICELLLLAKVVFQLLLSRQALKGSVMMLLGLMFTVLHIMIFSTQIDYLGIIKLITRVLLVAHYLRTMEFAHNRHRTAKIIGYTFAVSMLIMMLLSQNEAYLASVSGYLRVVRYDTSSSLLRNGGLLDDPNYCSMAIIVSLTFLTVLYYYRHIKSEYWLLVVPLFVLGFTTYSKSYMIMAVTFTIALLLLVLLPKRRSLALILSAVVVIASIAVFSGKIELINRIFVRFQTGDLTTGRMVLNQQYIDYICSDMRVLFFGEGFDADKLPQASGLVHNLYLEMFYKLGVIGSLAFIGAIIGCFPRRHDKSKLVNYIPVVFVAVMYMALAGMNSYGLFYYILLAGISVLQIRDFSTSEHALQGCFPE